MRSSGARPRLRWLWRWLGAGIDLLFPPRCMGCGAAGADWCAECASRVLRLTGKLCPICGEPLGRQRRCAACARQPLPLTARSFGRYQAPLSHAIIGLKYRPNRRMAARMGAWLADLCRQEAWPATMVVPVPLGARRLRQRGYNQVGLVASALGQELALPVRPDALHRVRETQSQVGLDPVSRLHNVRGAFRAVPRIVGGQQVLLVDDLFTTGATLTACAEALAEAGAATVYAVTVGRA